MRHLRSHLCLVLLAPLCSASLPAAAASASPAPEPDEDDEGDDEFANDSEDAAEVPPSPAEQKASRQIVGGAVAGSFGFILSLVAFGLLGARSTCELEGNPDCARDMGIAALATGIPGLALMATGGTLLGLGIKRRRALGAPPTALVSPTFGRRFAGASFTLRF